MERLTLAEVEGMEVIEQWHTDNLIYRDETTRITVSRLDVSDGMPYNNQVTVEQLDENYNWITVDEYEAL